MTASGTTGRPASSKGAATSFAPNLFSPRAHARIRGCDTFWMAKHHFQPKGTELIPNVLMIAGRQRVRPAAVAVRLQKGLSPIREQMVPTSTQQTSGQAGS